MLIGAGWAAGTLTGFQNQGMCGSQLGFCLQMSERLLDVENEAMVKIVELEKQLMQTNKELDQLRVSAAASALSPLTLAVTFSFKLSVCLAGSVRQRQHSGSHLKAHRPGEGPDHPSAESSGASGSGGPAGRRTWSTSASERRGRRGGGRLCLPLPSALPYLVSQVRDTDCESLMTFTPTWS